MAIRVEFYGVARNRAGVATAMVPVCGPTPLQQILQHLAAEFPEFAAECLLGFDLRPSYVANIDGQRFVREPQTRVDENACLLIMSADAGG